MNPELVKQLLSELEADSEDYPAARSLRRHRQAKSWAAIIITFAGIIGGGITWVYQAGADAQAEKLQQEEMKEKVSDVERRVNAVEDKVDNIRNMTVRQQVQLIEGIRFLSTKIDAKRPAGVKEPASIREAGEWLDRWHRREVSEPIPPDPKSLAPPLPPQEPPTDP